MRADDIVRQRFTKVFRGYDVQEVDIFLDEVIRTIEGLEGERDMLLSRLDAVLRELEQYDALMYTQAERQGEAPSPVEEQAANLTDGEG